MTLRRGVIGWWRQLYMAVRFAAAAMRAAGARRLPRSAVPRRAATQARYATHDMRTAACTRTPRCRCAQATFSPLAGAAAASACISTA